eukprot:scaffold50833_cov20-Tisochrysis_lutea.AAC.1
MDVRAPGGEGNAGCMDGSDLEEMDIDQDPREQGKKMEQADHGCGLPTDTLKRSSSAAGARE